MSIGGRYVQSPRSSYFESRLSRLIGDLIGEERNVYSNTGSLQTIAPAGRHVYSKHNQPNPKAPAGRHVCSLIPFLIDIFP